MLFEKMKVLSENEIEKIVEYALKILETKGCIFQSEQALRLLSDLGCQVDSKTSRVAIPSSLIVDILDEFQQIFRPQDFPKIVMGQATVLWDAENQKGIEGKLKDCEKIVALGNNLSNVSIVTCGIEPNDVPPLQRKQAMAETALKYGKKPFCLNTSSSALAEDVLEMASIAFGSVGEVKQRKVCIGRIPRTMPLCYTEEEIKLLHIYSQYQQPIYLTTSFDMGQNITLPNLLTLQLAEWLAGVYFLVCIESVSPISIQIPMAKLESNPLYQKNALHFLLLESGAIQILHHLGLSACIPLTPTPCRSFPGGWLAGINRTLGWDADYLTGAGKLDEHTFSPIQLIIENDLASYLKQIIEGMEIEKSVMGFGEENKVAKDSIKWDSQILHYDWMELWRTNKKDIEIHAIQSVSEQWNRIAPVCNLQDSAIQEMARIRQTGKAVLQHT